MAYPYIPHTDQDIQEMLQKIRINNIKDLFADIPDNILLKKNLNIPKAKSEFEIQKALSQIGAKNKTEYISFLGFGSYDHIIPAVVSQIVSRNEFYTSYTPYQAEISQGMLQAIFEFQTMICELTGLDVANASLYDGSTAVIEACVMALNSKRKADSLLISETVNPLTRAVVNTYFADLDVNIGLINEKEGELSQNELKEKLHSNVAALVTQSPNCFGILEDYSGLADILHENKINFILSANPISLPVCKSPAEWGADIAVGDTQVCGLAQNFGGPSAGYIAAKNTFLRKMPGRIAGQTLDISGNRAFVLTLQAREQHIKRQRATSNICSNQALAALATAVYFVSMGKQGMQEVSRQNIEKSHYLQQRLQNELNITTLFDKPFFNEFSLQINRDLKKVLNKMQNSGILAGIQLDQYFPDKLNNVIQITCTEKREKKEMDFYVDCLKRILE